MGGGGNDNSAMMMQMNQQQAASEERARQEAIATREYNTRRDTDARTAAVQDAERTRAYQIADRDYQQGLISAAQAKSDKAAADQKAEEKQQLESWQGKRDATYQGVQNDTDARLSALGINNDPSISSAIKSALGTAYSSIPDNATNVGSYFDGVYDKVTSQQRDARRTSYGSQLNTLLPTDFEQERVGDTADDSILEAILGEQFDAASADAKRLLDRGAITQEGYNANLKNLDSQKNTGRAKLTSLGNNELNSERTKLAGIANQGRAGASSYELGQTFDPTSYSNKVNSAYDNWFKGLGDTLKGLAPTDLFDTSGFSNTSGGVSGPTNSPFVGTTNALTGINALSDEENKKKQASAATATGVF